MNLLTPAYDKRIVLLQLFLVLLFSCCLYFFLFFYTEEKRVARELENVTADRFRLEQTVKNVHAYQKIVAENRSLHNLPPEFTWEEVEFNWDDLSFSELLRRLNGLSQQKKIFILESFTSGIGNTDNAVEGIAVTGTDSNPLADTTKRFFTIQGYFLCPCP